ncbi:MAG TPA: sulfide/dihydroorotate dehydrogenase-like FAD/NAD-binding protein [Syntrophales bacterium]|nr:sulfide/dihydroorotate dehydrogenase-like FAD/NAD-binding protein [Syntrophales bacterium]HOL58258.1 sulfide/dihydroorotate dehydrogenase-like FAD/NAD-binding protein [Syntrophales bacterium]HPO34427.1 sulfide/dihydroorotate dehydrogenase-like FAD/NAD-binding protein [Syntrophales bacterium]
MPKIVRKEILSENIIRMDIESEEIARRRKAGQFVIIRLHEQGERIPLTIVDSDPEKGTITIIFQVVGHTTALLSTLTEGAEILDLQGPLGNPTEIRNYGHAVCVGGGVGVGVVYPITKALKESGNRVTSIIGARTKSLLILERKMAAVSDRLIETTDDGSYGFHGFVSQALDELIKKGEEINCVFAIGPVPMMKAVAECTRPHGIKTFVSLNAIMVDGTGMCGACRVSVGGKTRFTCVDGPEFDGHEVDFDLLMKRLRMYCAQEQISYQRDQCRCGNGR